jgi:murein DD-endopeptidase MepM/ murein hydrolase activator NlpD
MAKAGTKVVAPVGGKIIKLSGHSPKKGAVSGAGGPLGWSLYLKGDDGKTYYMTHLGTRKAKLGQRVKAGTLLGTVADYASYGRPDHVHMGIRG